MFICIKKETLFIRCTWVHCGYHRYDNQLLSHQCALVVAVREGPLTLVNIKSAPPNTI